MVDPQRSSPRVVAIGEALWDVFPDGRRPGGAPCNVAFHAARLGDRGVIVTRVGADPLGDELIAFLDARGVDTSLAQRDPVRPTGTVSVVIDHGEPRYTIAEEVAWDHIAARDDVRAVVSRAEAICVGSLAQRAPASRAAIRQLLSDARDQALIVFDVNLRPPFVDPGVIESTARVADVVKMDESEVERLSSLLARPNLTAWLLGEVGVEAVCVTRGKDGASITTHRGAVTAPGIRIDTSTGDPVGAGDAFLAAMTHQLIRKTTPDETLDKANRYAALVASKPGAMPEVSPEELAEIGIC